MRIKEVNRLSIMRQIDKKIVSMNKAPEEMGISLRQAKRIQRRYAEHGEMGLLSRHQGKVSPSWIDPKLKNQLLGILPLEPQ